MGLLDGGGFVLRDWRDAWGGTAIDPQTTIIVALIGGIPATIIAWTGYKKAVQNGQYDKGRKPRTIQDALEEAFSRLIDAERHEKECNLKLDAAVRRITNLEQENTTLRTLITEGKPT